ncbi:hypothetical protein HK097_010645 [Rhizophlyctis rosea]|uniref:Uncharacterized protein n=1 Tax=Rhizophlyctis rosea TaxID=64517 RepID=A0AAD5X3M4_9FUNG|nr:hypothetical protein HK097_010645 [Rhizophlyctis rosea]
MDPEAMQQVAAAVMAELRPTMNELLAGQASTHTLVQSTRDEARGHHKSIVSQILNRTDELSDADINIALHLRIVESQVDQIHKRVLDETERSHHFRPYPLQRPYRSHPSHVDVRDDEDHPTPSLPFEDIPLPRDEFMSAKNLIVYLVTRAHPQELKHISERRLLFKVRGKKGHNAAAALIQVFRDAKGNIPRESYGDVRDLFVNDIDFTGVVRYGEDLEHRQRWLITVGFKPGRGKGKGRA